MRKTPLPAVAMAALLAAAAPLACRGPEAPAPGAGSVEERASAAGAPGSAATAAAPVEPVGDVLLVTIDTLRADSVGFMGNAEVKTPVLDRLAGAGRVFTNAHSHYPMTLPAHSSILTGLYPYQHGVRENGGFVLGEDIPTAAGILKARGFSTAAFVAAFPLDAEFGLNRGFDVYDDRYPELQQDGGAFVLPQRRGNEVVPLAVDWWKKQAGTRRFLWVHLFDPHRPYDAPEPFGSRHREQPYLGEVEATDAFLTPLLQPFLDGREAPALVVVVADHGEGLGDHGEKTHGLFAYQSTLHVPMIVWRPGVAPARDGRLARHVDILPTILEAVDVEPPPGLPGHSLLKPAATTPTTSYFEALAGALNRGWAPLRGVIRQDEKFIHLPIPELYDIAEDPGETANLVDERRRVVHDLRALLPAESSWPPQRGEIKEEVAKHLRSLGYLNETAEIKATYTADDDPKRLVALDVKLHGVVELCEQNRRPEAVALLREVLAERPDMPLAYTYLAQVLLDMNRREEALEVMQRARAQKIASTVLLTEMASTLTFLGRPQEAVEVLRPVAANAPPATLNALGLALIESGRPHEAVPVLETIFKTDPNNARAYENLGLAALQGRRWAEARQRFGKALELDPSLPASWNSMGVALYYGGEPLRALEAWEKAVTLDPTQYDALYNIGLKASELGQPAKARAALRRFIATAPPARYAADIHNAQALLRQAGG